MNPEAAMFESREMWKAIVDSTTVVLYVKDLEGRYILVNRRFEELFHVRNDEVRGKTDHDVFPKSTADAVRANDLRVREADTPVEFEEVVPHDDGEHAYVSIKFPLHGANGESFAICGISTDISARKRAETELEAAKHSLSHLVDERTAELTEANRRLTAEVAERVAAVERLQNLIDTAQEGIWIIDASGRTTFANPRMAEMLGYETDEMLGRPVFEFMSSDRQAEARGNLERRRNGIAEEHDFEFRRKDGTAVWTLLATNPVHDKDGTVVGALAMVTDITERKRAEQHQSLLLHELDHRVKNTLATVLALNDLTMENAESLDAFRSAFAGRVQAMARTHEALARARWQEVSLDEIVSTVLAPLGAGEVSRIAARGDAIRVSPRAITPLALALNELGTNALKHGALSCSGGGVTVEWRLPKGGEFTLSWTERDGPTATVPPERGTGLRLISGLIEHELEGAVSVEFPPEGLRCRITLPAAVILGG